MRHDTRRLVVVVAAGVQVAVEPREVAARHLDAQPVPRLEVVARRERLQRDLVDLARLHPHRRLLVALAPPHALDRLVEVVGAPVGVDVDHLDGEVGVLRVGRHVERRRDRAAELGARLERLRRVDEDVGPDFHLALIEGARRDRGARAAHVAAVRRDGLHRVVGERVGRVGGGRL